MNRFHTTLAIAALGALIVGWQLKHSNPPPAAAENVSLPEIPIAIDGDRAAVPEAVSGQSVAAADPFDFSRQIEASPDCQPGPMVQNPASGDLEQAWVCDRQPAEVHPYETWSEPVLAGMAYGDAKAAEVLGLRHIRSSDPNQEALGLMLLYRSVALSGETAALHRAISARYAVVSEGGEPDVHNLRQLLIFGIVTSQLGDRAINQSAIEHRLAKADVSEEEIRQIRSTADDILNQMAVIEREVTGNRSIEEALSNA